MIAFGEPFANVEPPAYTWPRYRGYVDAMKSGNAREKFNVDGEARERGGDLRSIFRID